MVFITSTSRVPVYNNRQILTYVTADNYVNGKAFLRLSQSDIRKLVAPIGLAKRIFSLIPKVHCCIMSEFLLLALHIILTPESSF